MGTRTWMRVMAVAAVAAAGCGGRSLPLEDDTPGYFVEGDVGDAGHDAARPRGSSGGSGSSSGSPSGAASSGSGSGSSSGSSSGSDVFFCPTFEPEVGVACASPGLTCIYYSRDLTSCTAKACTTGSVWAAAVAPGC